MADPISELLSTSQLFGASIIALLSFTLGSIITPRVQERYGKSRIRNALYREISQIYLGMKGLCIGIENGVVSKNQARFFESEPLFALYENTFKDRSTLELFYRLDDSLAIDYAIRILRAPFTSQFKELIKTDEDRYQLLASAVSAFEFYICANIILIDKKLLKKLNARLESNLKEVIVKLVEPSREDKNRLKSLFENEMKQASILAKEEAFRMGEDLFKHGQQERAIAFFSKALNIDPEDKDSLKRIAQAFDERGRFEEAIFYNEKSLALNPEDADAWHNEGVAYGHVMDYQNAIKCFSKALEVNPELKGSLLNRAIAEVKLNKFDDAMRDFDTTVQIDPKFVPGYLEKGRALEDQGLVTKDPSMYVQALKCYSKGLELKSNQAYFLILLNMKSRVLIALRNFKGALDCLDQILNIDPNYQPALEEKDLVERILVSETKVDYSPSV